MSVQKRQARPAQDPALSAAGRRQDIRFAEKDEALRQDVHALGTMIGELLIEQGGQPLYDSVETARQLAIEARVFLTGWAGVCCAGPTRRAGHQACGQQDERQGGGSADTGDCCR